MAELLSVQVHAPMTLTSVNVTTAPGHPLGPAGTVAVSVPVEMEHLKTDCGAARRLKKVDNATQDVGGALGSDGTLGGPGTKFDYLPKRRAVNIEFYQLTYTVSEGRKKGDHAITAFE